MPLEALSDRAMKRTLMPLLASILWVSLGYAQSAPSGPQYPTPKHEQSHGGHYQKGRGSAHKGGHYVNPGTQNHYGKHKKNRTQQ